jgi:hypothetical protein
MSIITGRFLDADGWDFPSTKDAGKAAIIGAPQKKLKSEYCG